MSPGDLLGVVAFAPVGDELLEERSSGVGAAPTAGPEVAGVGDFGIGHFLLKGGQEWHGPGKFADVVAGFVDSGSEIVIVGPQAGGFVAEGNDAGTGEGGKVNDVLGVVVGPCLPQTVGEDQTSLGVGVEHLNGFSREGGDDVTGSLCVGCRHVLGHAGDADDLPGIAAGGKGFHGAEDGGGTAHVVLHFVHVCTGLQRDAARVKGDAFADQHRMASFLVAVQGEDDHARFAR